MAKYYSLPVPFSELLQKKELPKCNLEDSIKNNILLILMSHFGEHRYDQSFGCSIWDQDFELLPSANIWRSQLKRTITESIERHEPRISDLDIVIKIDELPFTNPDDKKVRRIKKRISVGIEGRIKLTDELFSHIETLFFSPISLD